VAREQALLGLLQSNEDFLELLPGLLLSPLARRVSSGSNRSRSSLSLANPIAFHRNPFTRHLARLPGLPAYRLS
jgi:hypothetical protein